MIATQAARPHSLTQLPTALKAAGFKPPSYRSTWSAAVNGTIPAKKGRNGRWVYSPDDLPVIAQKLNLGLRPEAVGQPTPEDLSEVELETVSYNLPVEWVDTLRELAALRAAAIRKAKREGRTKAEARMSASAIVREALDAHRAVIEAELAARRV